ncbi:hypothetical protein [Haloferax sp. DFSO52]|uniref:hypothetical protein n=1 Tax=Haloferax sp. DFSO52 TaxID=3388505 RepID=UPI003A88097E
MDTGHVFMAGIGLAFFVVGAAQWYAPERHRLSWLVSTMDDPEGGEKAQKGMNSVVRALVVAGMYVAGFFLTLAWSTVFERLYTVFVTLLALR